eukprot:Awhi_evm2s1658
MLYKIFTPNAKEQAKMEKDLHEYPVFTYQKQNTKELVLIWIKELRILLKLNKLFNSDVGKNIKYSLPTDFIEHQQEIRMKINERVRTATPEEKKRLLRELDDRKNNDEILTNFQLFCEDRIRTEETGIAASSIRINNVQLSCINHPHASSHSTENCRIGGPSKKRTSHERRYVCVNHPNMSICYRCGETKSHSIANCPVKKISNIKIENRISKEKIQSRVTFKDDKKDEDKVEEIALEKEEEEEEDLSVQLEFEEQFEKNDFDF